jgi:hypothetical protein
MYETGNFPMGVWVTIPKREILFSHLNTDKKTWINDEFNIMRPFPLHPHLAHLRRQQLPEHLMSWKVCHLQLSLHKLIIILRVYLMTKSFFFALRSTLKPFLGVSQGQPGTSTLSDESYTASH